MRLALFTGAGVSKAFGFPLTGELLPIIRGLLRESERSERQELHAFIQRVYPGFHEAPDDGLPLITDLLSIIDSSIQSRGALGLRDGEARLRAYRLQLDELIYKALGWDTDYSNSKKDQEDLQRLTDLAGWLRSLYDASGHSLGILSTNYDIALESSVRGDLGSLPKVPEKQLRQDLDLGFAWRDPDNSEVIARPAQARLRTYKLHGSLDILRCPMCDHVFFNRWGNILHQAFKRRVDDYNSCGCGYGPLEPMLVAPSLVRDIRDSTLLEVWRHSIEFLRSADHWVFAGYSFPGEDVAIRTLILRAMLGREKPPAVSVIQHGTNAETLKQYRLMLPDCGYETGGVEALIGAVKGARDPEGAFLRYIRGLPSVRKVKAKSAA